MVGKGFLRERKAVRAAQFNQIVRECQRLAAENEKLKSDPEGVVGQFLAKLNTLALQNNKLSALTAALLKAAGGKVVLAKVEIESFANHRVTIKVSGDAEKEEDVVNYEFSYDSQKVENTAPVTESTPITVDSLPNTTVPEEVLSVEPFKEN